MDETEKKEAKKKADDKRKEREKDDIVRKLDIETGKQKTMDNAWK